MANPGKKLYFSRFGGEQPIPPEFIAAMERWETKQSLGESKTGPEELSDTVVESRVETDRTNERIRVTIGKKPGVVGPLLDFRTTDTGQGVQVEATLFRTGTKGYPVPQTATTNVVVKDLGNGWSIQEIATEGSWVNGVFVPGIFSGNVFEKAKDKVIPPRFTSDIPVVTTRIDEEGTAEMPELTGDELRERQEQISQFKKRTEISSQPNPELPVILNKGKDTNERKQTVGVVETLMDAADAVETPTVLKDVKVTQISPDLKIEEVRTILALFGAKLYSEEVPDNIPQEFRVAVPVTSTEEIVAGTAELPVLEAGDLLRSEQQVTELTKLVKLVTRAGLSLPVTLVSKETNEDKQVVLVTRVLRVNDGNDTEPTALTDVVVQNLGDGNVVETTKTKPSVLDKAVYQVTTPDVVPPRFQTEDKTEVKHKFIGTAGVPTLSPGIYEKSESQIDAFVKETTVTTRDDSSPAVLEGQIYDEVLDIPIQFSETLEGANTSLGNNRKEITPLNEDLDQVRTWSITPIQAVLDSYAKSFAGTTNVDLPPELISLQPYVEGTASAGSYNENGFYTLAGQGSGSISLRGSAQGSASILTDLGFEINQPWGSNVSCIHYLFFVASGTSRAATITKLNTLFSIAAADWPKFVPKALSFACQGQKMSAETNMSAHASDSIHTDFNGDIKHQGLIRTTGTGQSFEVGSSLKVVRIPPTIHQALSVGGYSAHAAFTASGTISTGVNSQSGFVAGQADGVILPASVAATAGQATITAGLGLRVCRIVSEIAKYDRIRVHCEVVNFADIV